MIPDLEDTPNVSEGISNVTTKQPPRRHRRRRYMYDKESNSGALSHSTRKVCVI